MSIGFIPLSFDVLIIAHLCGFVKGFFTFFFEPSKVSQWLRPPDLPASAGSDFGGTPCTPLPLTRLFYHTSHQKSRGNFAQLREKIFVQNYSNFLLTNWWEVCYNKISAAHICERPADLCKMTKGRGRPLCLFIVHFLQDHTSPLVPHRLWFLSGQ